MDDASRSVGEGEGFFYPPSQKATATTVAARKKRKSLSGEGGVAIN